MPRIPQIVACCGGALIAAVLSGCVAHRPTAQTHGTIAGIAPLPALRTSPEGVQDPAMMASPATGNVLDRSQWEPIALLAPNDLTLHPPHYAPPRLPTTGDWRYEGNLPTVVTAHKFGSTNGHQLKSLAYEPFLQAYDLIMIPVRMFTQTPPNQLDASPDATYIRAPEAWGSQLPATGRPIGPTGGSVISRPAEARQL
ncbi:MAG: hypothetical protein ACIAS6_15225 [Phycisphaerales bacterium JB060]